MLHRTDPLFYRDTSGRLVRRDPESPASSESLVFSSSVLGLASIAVSGIHIDLPVESVSNPFFQFESVSESESVQSSCDMADQRLANRISLRQHIHPARITPPGPIVFPFETPGAHNAFTVKPGVLNSLPTFYGRECDDPYEHIRLFEGLVLTLATHTQYETACLKLFEATLKDDALRWFRMQKPQSFTTWEQVRDAFYRKYFSEAKTKNLRRQIQGFRQDKGESFFQSLGAF